jgi:hypothetical protein
MRDGEYTCRHCGAPFEPIKVNQTFCTPHCKNLFHEVPRALRVIDSRLVTIGKAAELANRKHWQIRYAIKAGRLRTVTLLDRPLLFRSDVVTLFSSDLPSD